MAVDDSASDAVAPPLSGEGWSLPQALREHISLTRVQGLCGMAAALLSIGGAFGYLVPVRHDRGEVLAIVQEARSGRPVANATVEVLTLQDALVTTVPPVAVGSARVPMKEGTYRLRVTHPRYVTESRQIYVLAGQTAEIHMRLAARPAPPPPPSAAVVPDKSTAGPMEEIKKLFH
jgi:hypothetical protein